ncbi:hypothetical protein Y695_03285 [Hydrogenophaga sp. T4]|nr:hypothetical protein Y695_03285 [Hydrogenophaga sp. T4]
MPRIRACNWVTKSIMPATSVMASIMLRSAPAMNSGLEDVTTTPLTAESAWARFTASAKAGMDCPLRTFIGTSCMAQVMVAMPSASTL